MTLKELAESGQPCDIRNEGYTQDSMCSVYGVLALQISGAYSFRRLWLVPAMHALPASIPYRLFALILTRQMPVLQEHYEQQHSLWDSTAAQAACSATLIFSR